MPQRRIGHFVYSSRVKDGIIAAILSTAAALAVVVAAAAAATTSDSDDDAVGDEEGGGYGGEYSRDGIYRNYDDHHRRDHHSGRQLTIV